ncbi:MAG: hypothetical protein QNJ54_24325 [Prochloraceae cyanobacterium]|nr:hypothetical protein [Prochloraceae cyanobacterium]
MTLELSSIAVINSRLPFPILDRRFQSSIAVSNPRSPFLILDRRF